MGSTFFELMQKPLYQALFFALLSIGLIVVIRPKIPNTVYKATGIVYGGFILVNSLFIFFAPSVWPYFFYSLLCSIGYVALLAMTNSTYIKQRKLKGSSASAMVFLMIIYHPIALLICIFFSWFYKEMS